VPVCSRARALLLIPCKHEGGELITDEGLRAVAGGGWRVACQYKLDRDRWRHNIINELQFISSWRPSNCNSFIML
jgi:hypothetical protein